MADLTSSFPKWQVVVSYSSFPSWAAKLWPLLDTAQKYWSVPSLASFVVGSSCLFLFVLLLREKHISQENSSWLCFVNCAWYIKQAIISSSFLALAKNLVFTCKWTGKNDILMIQKAENKTFLETIRKSKHGMCIRWYVRIITVEFLIYINGIVVMLKNSQLLKLHVEIFIGNDASSLFLKNSG